MIQLKRQSGEAKKWALLIDTFDTEWKYLLDDVQKAWSEQRNPSSFAQDWPKESKR